MSKTIRHEQTKVKNCQNKRRDHRDARHIGRRTVKELAAESLTLTRKAR